VKVQIDMGFGDPIVPGPERIEFPVLLDLPAPDILGYSRESVIAEKFEAMVRFGIANSRMKDFYDLWVLVREFPFDGEILSRALSATFERRGTAIPADVPVGLSSEFALDTEKQAQWRAFLARGGLEGGGVGLEEVAKALWEFLVPVTDALLQGGCFDPRWPAGGPWA
jgi:hypothetical protein